MNKVSSNPFGIIWIFEFLRKTRRVIKCTQLCPYLSSTKKFKKLLIEKEHFNHLTEINYAKNSVLTFSHIHRQSKILKTYNRLVKT